MKYKPFQVALIRSQH